MVGKWVKCFSSQACYDPTSAKSMEILPVDFCQFWIKHFWKRGKRQDILSSLSFSSKKLVSLKFLSCANVIPLDSGLHWNGIKPRNIRARYLGNELSLSSGNELLWCASIPAGCGSQALQNIVLQITLLLPVPSEGQWPPCTKHRLYWMYFKILLSCSDFSPFHRGALAFFV